MCMSLVKFEEFFTCFSRCDFENKVCLLFEAFCRLSVQCATRNEIESQDSFLVPSCQLLHRCMHTRMLFSNTARTSSAARGAVELTMCARNVGARVWAYMPCVPICIAVFICTPMRISSFERQWMWTRFLCSIQFFSSKTKCMYCIAWGCKTERGRPEVRNTDDLPHLRGDMWNFPLQFIGPYPLFCLCLWFLHCCHSIAQLSVWARERIVVLSSVCACPLRVSRYRGMLMMLKRNITGVYENMLFLKQNSCFCPRKYLTTTSQTLGSSWEKYCCLFVDVCMCENYLYALVVGVMVFVIHSEMKTVHGNGRDFSKKNIKLKKMGYENILRVVRGWMRDDCWSICSWGHVVSGPMENSPNARICVRKHVVSKRISDFRACFCIFRSVDLSISRSLSVSLSLCFSRVRATMFSYI